MRSTLVRNAVLRKAVLPAVVLRRSVLRKAVPRKAVPRKAVLLRAVLPAVVLGTCLAVVSMDTTASADVGPPGASVAKAATTSGCASPTSKGAQAGVKIADPACNYDYVTNAYTGKFTPMTSATGAALSRTYTGTDDHAAYRIEVPKDWNGSLVLYAHPYQGVGNVVWVDSPALRSWFVSHGYAWAASSFAKNGYDVGNGVTETQDLLKVFAARTSAKATSVYLTGESMGGQVAAVEAEDFKGDFAGVMPYCAPLGGTELYDYYLGANVTAAALAKVSISFPSVPSLASVLQYEADVVTSVLPRLGTGFLAPGGPKLTAAGKEWETALSYLSGGPRPGFTSAFDYWSSMSYGPLSGMPTLFDLYPGLDGGTAGIASGNITSNIGVTYYADSSSKTTAADKALNAEVLRVKATTSTPAGKLSGIPPAVGDPGVPVLALYGTGDLLVPLSMGQDYARAMAAHGESDLFVARAIREVTHCGFSTAELSQGFSSLVSWVDTGHKAAGDDITSPAALDSATFGCRFTDGAHAGFVGPACPPPKKPPTKPPKKG